MFSPPVKQRHQSHWISCTFNVRRTRMTSKFGAPIKKYKIGESPDVLPSCQEKSTFWQQSFKCWTKLDWHYVGSILSTLASSNNVCKKLKKIIKKICKVSKTGKIFEGRLLLSDQLFYSRLSWQQSNSSSPHIDRDACPPQVFLYLNGNISWQQSNSSSSSSSHIDRSVLSCWQSSSRLLNSQVGSPGTIKISLERVFNASKQQSSRQTERAQISVVTQDWHFQYNCCA